MKKLLWSAGVTLLVTSGFTCGGSGPEVPLVFTKFTANVKVSRDGDFIVLQTNDLPNHKSPYYDPSDPLHEAYTGSNVFQKNRNWIGQQDITFRIPVNPQATTTAQSPGMGPIGIALNGIVLYNQFAAGGLPLDQEIKSFDQYNGHPQDSDQYHYHIEPLYLTKDDKAALIGWLLDGFPVYGPMENGTTVLDSDLELGFHGHSGATTEYPDGIYHYHISANAPYIAGKYKGTPGTVAQ